ncbi:tigger transposable element-derived protein 1-like [Portunus trituberculatus]|uniref:tigger transposable element-derived protein 1-like n=1 Tax=Portunus trituberculatus TaxID=210409 RepID=UPI001E1CDE63|nr:tigger transposable element-derived protein 1-like [Portunus trituberculatus]
MSSKTFISQEEEKAPGFKAAKDRLTLTLGGNAEGDLKLKPFVIYQSENPRALKGFTKAQLPVIWKSNKKAWLTSSLCQDYVCEYLSPTLKEYAAANNIANRFLLLIDNAPSHPRATEDWADNIEVLFLPPNITSLIQPMDQSVIATFKAYYQRHTMAQLVQTLDSNPEVTIQQYWRNYNIKKGIDNITTAWNEVDNKTMNAAWSKVWPEVVINFTGFVPVSVTDLRKDIVRLSHRASFEEVDEEDVQELLDSHRKPLTNKELEEMLNERAHQETTKPEKERVLTINFLQEFFCKIESAIDSLKEVDPNYARSFTAAHEIEKALGFYKEILAAKRRKATQPSIESYFRPSTPSTKSSVSPTPSLSRDIAQSISSRSYTPSSPVASTSFPRDQDSPDVISISYSSDSD